MPEEIERLSRTIMRSPVRIAVSPPHRPPPTIRHEAYPVPQHLKTSLLVRLLGREDMMSVLVFVRTKRRADRVARQVGQARLDVARIHGDQSQGQRETALAGFRSGRHQVLVATDVAARGIDVEGICHVINYDVPMVPTDYVHRVGRTARMEAAGEAITFVTPEDEGGIRAIERSSILAALKDKVVVNEDRGNQPMIYLLCRADSLAQVLELERRLQALKGRRRSISH